MASPQAMRITDAAASRVKELMAQRQDGEAPMIGLRIGVGKRGCSGMSYEMEYATEKKPLDEVVEDKGITLLIDVQAQPLRLRYRLIGTAIVQAMQRDNTGAWYDELYGPELLEEIYAGFRWILAHRAPLRTYGQAFYPDRRFYRYEVLNLPLSTDGQAIDMVLGELLFTLQSEG